MHEPETRTLKLRLHLPRSQMLSHQPAVCPKASQTILENAKLPSFWFRVSQSVLPFYWLSSGGL